MSATPPRMFPPMLALLSAVVMVAIDALFPLEHIVPPPFNRVGWGLVLLGVSMNLAAARIFRRRGTTISPVGVPATVARDGLYRISRNPMYLGMVLALFGVGVVLGSLAPLSVPVVFAWYVDRRFIAREEAVMAQRFGDEYCDYRARVRRWL